MVEWKRNLVSLGQLRISVDGHDVARSLSTIAGDHHARHHRVGSIILISRLAQAKSLVYVGNRHGNALGNWYVPGHVDLWLHHDLFLPFLRVG